jgi:hypothetical protein
MPRNLKIEKMSYQDNKLSYNLGLWGFFLNLYYLVVTLNKLDISYHLGIEITISLVTFMLLFLAMERVKRHDYLWSYIMIGLGISYLMRVAYLPMKLFEQGNNLLQAATEVSKVSGSSMIEAGRQSMIALIVISIVVTISGVVSLIKASRLRNYEKQLQEEK